MSEQDLSDLKNFFHVSESQEAIHILETEKLKKSERLNTEVKQFERSNEEEQFQTRKRGPLYLPCVVGQIDDKHFLLRYDYR
jgi:hypothetical protein